MARPTLYNEERGRLILDLYSDGINLQQIEKKRNLPSRRTILRWRTDFPEFGKLYDQALLSYSECIIEEALRIADTEPDAKKAKNRIDIRTWIASKYNRARFGDKIDIDVRQTVDISPALQLAIARMALVGTGDSKLIEADITPK